MKKTLKNRDLEIVLMSFFVKIEETYREKPVDF